MTLPVATILIYLVMVGLFRSFLDPLIILCAVPLGFIGVIWMLLLTQTSVNVESQIGTLMMIGIVVSNSVLLVDFANGLVREGMPLEEAVVQAGRLRIRPVLMTALATILGLAPMALGFGEGSESNIPLARAVIGGLLVSTFMTLLFVPILHTLVQRRAPEVAPTPSATGRRTTCSLKRYMAEPGNVFGYYSFSWEVWGFWWEGIITPGKRTSKTRQVSLTRMKKIRRSLSRLRLHRRANQRNQKIQVALGSKLSCRDGTTLTHTSRLPGYYCALAASDPLCQGVRISPVDWLR